MAGASDPVPAHLEGQRFFRGKLQTPVALEGTYAAEGDDGLKVWAGSVWNVPLELLAVHVRGTPFRASPASLPPGVQETEIVAGARDSRAAHPARSGRGSASGVSELRPPADPA